MSQDAMAQGLLILIAPVHLEEILVDFLLQKNELSGFTTSHVSGHGRHHAESAASLSMVEQVAGRQKRVQFMMHASFDTLQSLIDELKQRFKHTGMHFILMPMTEAQSI
jgi:nitrogen regulatory protein PII